MNNYKIFIYFCVFIITPVLPSEHPNAWCYGKRVLGTVEEVVLLDNNVILDAKIDTGANMSSLSALDIHTFKKKNKKWVQFVIISPQSHKKFILTKPVIRYVHIRKRSDEVIGYDTKSAPRPVIVISIRLGDINKTVLCNLVDRQNFRYPMLLGADALKKFNAIVDVSKTHLLQ